MNTPPPLNLPPPLPPDGRKFRRVAWASCLAAAIGILTSVLGMVAGRSSGGVEHPIVALIALGIFGAGCILGIVAFSGVSRYGKRRILVPSILGISVNLFLLVLAVPNFFFAAISVATQGTHAPQEPVVHLPSSQVLKDGRLGFSIDIPKGFSDCPEAKVRPSIAYGFVQGSSTRGEQVRFITIENLDALIPKGVHPTTNSITGADTVKITRRKWRGLEVDVTEATSKDDDFTTLLYNIQIPLRPKAILVVVAGAEADREELSRLADVLLASVEGETNW